MNLKSTLLGGGAVVALAFTLVGCSAGGDSPAATDGAAAITLVPGTKGSPFYEAMACGAQAAADEFGATLTVAAPDTWGAATQLPVLDTVAAQNPDALLVVPTDVDALTERLQSIKDAGTPIVELDQKITDDSVSVSRIASDDTEGGRLAAQALAEQIGGSGKVMAISSPPGTDAQYVRVDGFKQELEENYPDIEFIGEEYALNDVTAAAGFVTAALASDPDLAGIFVANDVNAIGAVTGLEEAGAVGTVKVVAYDAAETEVDALNAGSVQALIAQDPYGEGYQGVQQALAALDGEATEATISIPLQILTTEDAAGLEEYLARNGSC
ncbi:ABC transporter substrate-binding protein [Herbiconiux moechotypicola]|uniref:ABC transporter substrate-binding protein n=1 Tax=Herbiconiux moechotypicola TaxID=637393 RepID=A0ABN3DAF6_9MICO|nr:ABC transporter substrate-binding protein [Herbiconiux moechotypicola]MCS5729006.1 ABC transporter substrate-binding protein [Herbiconiux moechotypicola]